MREERQVQAFLAILGTAIAAMTLWRYATGNVPLSTTPRQSAFNVTSILTDTGFATTDFGTWGTGAQGMFLILMFIGGCAGSTSGAIKIFRWQLMGRTLMGQFRQTLSLHRVVVTRYGSRNVTDDMLSSVRTFFFMYLMTWGVLSLALMLPGLDLLSATSAVAQAMANAGPGLGPLVGPGTNFAAIPNPAKWLLALAMLLGRLEFTAVFILLVPDFWNR